MWSSLSSNSVSRTPCGADGCSNERQPNVRTGRGPECVSQLPKGSSTSNLECPHFKMIPASPTGPDGIGVLLSSVLWDELSNNTHFSLLLYISQRFFKSRAPSTHVGKRKAILASRAKQDGLRTAGCSSPMDRNDTTLLQPQNAASHLTRDSASTTRITTYTYLDVRISTIRDHPFEYRCYLHVVTCSHKSGKEDVAGESASPTLLLLRRSLLAQTRSVYHWGRLITFDKAPCTFTSHLTSAFNFVNPVTPKTPMWSTPQGFQTNILYVFFTIPHACYTRTHLILLDVIIVYERALLSLKVPRFRPLVLLIRTVLRLWWCVWSIDGMLLTGEHRSTERKICASGTLSITNVTRIGLAWLWIQTSAVRGRPASDRQSHGKASETWGSPKEQISSHLTENTSRLPYNDCLLRQSHEHKHAKLRAPEWSIKP